MPRVFEKRRNEQTFQIQRQLRKTLSLNKNQASRKLLKEDFKKAKIIFFIELTQRKFENDRFRFLAN